VLARAEADLLTGFGDEQGRAQREQMQMRHQTDGSRRFGMVLLDGPFNSLSTRFGTGS
jgi:hypothetical protein